MDAPFRTRSVRRDRWYRWNGVTSGPEWALVGACCAHPKIQSTFWNSMPTLYVLPQGRLGDVDDAQSARPIGHYYFICVFYLLCVAGTTVTQ